MGDIQLLIDLVTAVVAAFAGGLLAQRLGQPVLLGYLAAGVVLGPFTPGPTANQHTVGVLSEIGVALLLFALGAEFSLGELRSLGRVASLGGALQIVGTASLGPLLAPLLGLSLVQGLFLGSLLALSSTVVVLKVLLAREEVGSLHGRVAVGMLLVQDLAVVPIAVVLPILAGGGEDLFASLGLAVLKAGGVLLGAYLLGARFVPWLLNHVAVGRSREIFLLAVVGLALGTALLTQLAGLSLAFGAFLAGLVVAESEYRAQVVAEVLPLRDLFVALFFVSVGMLIDPLRLLDLAGLVTLLSAVTVLGKVVVVVVVVLLLGLPGRVAVMTGLSLAQVGEFSFVLARLGIEQGAVPPEVFDLILAVALVSILLTPTLLRAGPGLTRLAERLPLIGGRFAEPVEADPAVEELRQHTVICGFGRVARELAQALERRGFRYLVIEYNPEIVRELRGRSVPAIYGDAANPVVLEHAHLERARLLAVLIPDAQVAEVVTRQARLRYPRLDIVARAASAEQVEQLRRAGATEAVQPEFEAGLEVIRHALHRYGVRSQELVNVVSVRRAAFYRPLAAEPNPTNGG